jgi:predicted unusual protein kinase regulating ubiquinone biosynthesis (AarF/ABC1/UbiB family)
MWGYIIFLIFPNILPNFKVPCLSMYSFFYLFVMYTTCTTNYSTTPLTCHCVCPVLALLKFDGYRAGSLMLERRANDPGVEGFCLGVQEVVDRSIHERTLEHMGTYVNMLCALSYKYKVKLVPEFLMVAMAVKVSEGVGTQLYPDLEFGKVAVPYIMKAQSKYMLDKTLHKLHIKDD